MLARIESKPGSAALDSIHIHVSRTVYGTKGVTKHINLREVELKYVEFVAPLRDCEVRELLISESPNLEGGYALLLQESYHSPSWPCGIRLFAPFLI